MKTVDEIKSMPIWMLWKKRARGTQMSKIPIAADGRSCGTSENYADRWVTFDEAQQAATERKADGIGFRMPTRGCSNVDRQVITQNKTSLLFLPPVYHSGEKRGGLMFSKKVSSLASGNALLVTQNLPIHGALSFRNYPSLGQLPESCQSSVFISNIPSEQYPMVIIKFEDRY